MAPLPSGPYWLSPQQRTPPVSTCSFPATELRYARSLHPPAYGTVKATATSFAPACGPDPSHQANWEITISTTDTTQLAPGQTWNQIYTAINLGNWSNFAPGTSTWFSGPCGSGSPYAADSHFAVYYHGQLVFSSGIDAPDWRAARRAAAHRVRDAAVVQRDARRVRSAFDSDCTFDRLAPDGSSGALELHCASFLAV